MSALRSQAARTVLERIRAADEVARAAADGRLKTRLASSPGSSPTLAETIEIYRDAPLAVAREVGELLYALAFSSRPARIVEFGTSFGVSAIYLAAALADAGRADTLLIACEAHPEKARIARANLEEAGLGHLVDVHQGDARETLEDVRGPIDMLFLDGLNSLYLPMLRLLEERLAVGAQIVADVSAGDPDQPAYKRYVRDPANGYASVIVGLNHGVELSIRLPPLGDRG